MFVIVNPASANKSTAKEWPAYEKLLKEAGYSFNVAYTEYPNHGTEIARQALKKGYKTIVSVGGDGTMNEVVNGFFEDGALINEDARLAVFSRGTGCDLIRTLGIDKGIEDLLSILERNTVKKVDVGVSEFIGYDGIKKIRYFLNESDIGIGGETTNRVNQRSKVFKGFLSFLIGAIITLVHYKNKYFEVVIDDTTEIKGMMNSVVIANGKYFGGGMKVAPEASMTDGVFDIVVIGDVNKLEFIKSFPLIYSGKHLKHPKLKLYKGKKVKVHCSERALFEVDGEQPGTSDAQYEILPAALNILI